MLPSSYLESREAFLRLGANLGAKPGRFFYDDIANGSPRLSTDIVYLGPGDAPTIVVVASGTHGVEGYAGAACQLQFMQTYQNRFANNGIAYLLVHAVNPWGFFHDRRVTREGVDLNRNFVDFPVTDREHSGYRAYHKRLITNFRPFPARFWNEVRLLSCAFTSKRRQALQAAITAGQYEYADGLFFGGTAVTQSRRLWEEIIRANVGGRKRAVLLDIHTGLGRRGVGEIISYLAPSAADFQQLSRWFDGGIKSMASGDAVSTAVEGTLTAAFDRMVVGKSYAIGLEFGTRSPIAVLNALRADHWYHNNAAVLPEAQREKVRQKMKDAFAASDARWHAQVIERFALVMQQLTQGLTRTVT